ncbi:MAG: cell division protein FtsQ/DivIB [Chitinophagaceae bacterium]
MKIKRSIRKMIIVGFWLIAGSGVLILLIAAIRSRNHQVCEGYAVDISGPKEQWFMNKKDVVDLLTKNGTVVLKGKPIQEIDLRRIEERMEKDPWVKNVELFFDNNEMLQVKVEEREPVARIFTVGGNSFYVDSSGEQLPLSEKLSARVPVFTSYPTEKIKLRGADSLLVQQVKQLSAFILKDPFWMAQVSQIDITPVRTFEIIPTIGSHVVEFGDGSDYEKKFKRLLRFYQQVLNKTGMNAYERINVQYDKQVIGIKKGAPMSRYDSLQAVRNVAAMIASSNAVQQQAMMNDGATAAVTNNEKPVKDSNTVSVTSTIASPANPPVKTKPYESSRATSGQKNKPAAKPAAARKPKAVMPTRNKKH